MFKKNTLYQSEISLFINKLKIDNPKITEQQLSGRMLLWDKYQNKTSKEVGKFNIKQNSYVYFPFKNDN